MQAKKDAAMECAMREGSKRSVIGEGKQGQAICSGRKDESRGFALHRKSRIESREVKVDRKKEQKAKPPPSGKTSSQPWGGGSRGTYFIRRDKTCNGGPRLEHNCDSCAAVHLFFRRRKLLGEQISELGSPRRETSKSGPNVHDSQRLE